MSGAELRILAELSGEESWIEAFNRNLDMHSKIARMMQEERWDASKGINCRFAHDEQKCNCPEHKKMRDGAKAGALPTAQLCSHHRTTPSAINQSIVLDGSVAAA